MVGQSHLEEMTLGQSQGVDLLRERVKVMPVALGVVLLLLEREVVLPQLKEQVLHRPMEKVLELHPQAIQEQMPKLQAQEMLMPTLLEMGRLRGVLEAKARHQPTITRLMQQHQEVLQSQHQVMLQGLHPVKGVRQLELVGQAVLLLPQVHSLQGAQLQVVQLVARVGVIMCVFQLAVDVRRLRCIHYQLLMALAWRVRKKCVTRPARASATCTSVAEFICLNFIYLLTHVYSIYLH